MPCNSPKLAYKTSKGIIVFNENNSDIVETVELPCNRCLLCHQAKKLDWTIRLVCEGKMHKSSFFATITYDDEHLHTPSLCKADMQGFNHRLRDELRAIGHPPIKIAYVGEYGGETQRPHYHGCYFGLNLTDLKYYKGGEGRRQYESAFLSNIWKRGQILVADFTPATAGYIAGYLMKADPDKTDLSRLTVTDPTTGECFKRAPEFFQPSLRPGIGKSFIEKYHCDVTAEGLIVFNEQLVPAPHYFIDQIKNLDPAKWQRIKEHRADYAAKHALSGENTPARLAVKTAVREAALRQKNTGSI